MVAGRRHTRRRRHCRRNYRNSGRRCGRAGAATRSRPNNFMGARARKKRWTAATTVGGGHASGCRRRRVAWPVIVHCGCRLAPVADRAGGRSSREKQPATSVHQPKAPPPPYTSKQAAGAGEEREAPGRRPVHRRGRATCGLLAVPGPRPPLSRALPAWAGVWRATEGGNAGVGAHGIRIATTQFQSPGRIVVGGSDSFPTLPETQEYRILACVV